MGCTEHRDLGQQPRLGVDQRARPPRGGGRRPLQGLLSHLRGETGDQIGSRGQVGTPLRLCDQGVVNRIEPMGGPVSLAAGVGNRQSRTAAGPGHRSIPTGRGLLEKSSGVLTLKGEQGQVAAQHRPRLALDETARELGRGAVDTCDRFGTGAVFDGSAEGIEIHRRGRSQPDGRVARLAEDRLRRLRRPIAAQNRCEDVHRSGRMNGFRVRSGAGRPRRWRSKGGSPAAPSQRDIEVLAAEVIAADDVAGVGGDTLAGVDGRRVTQAGVRDDVVGGQTHPRIGVAPNGDTVRSRPPRRRG